MVADESCGADNWGGDSRGSGTRHWWCLTVWYIYKAEFLSGCYTSFKIVFCRWVWSWTKRMTLLEPIVYRLRLCAADAHNFMLYLKLISVVTAELSPDFSFVLIWKKRSVLLDRSCFCCTSNSVLGFHQVLETCSSQTLKIWEQVDYIEIWWLFWCYVVYLLSFWALLRNGLIRQEVLCLLQVVLLEQLEFWGPYYALAFCSFNFLQVIFLWFFWKILLPSIIGSYNTTLLQGGIRIVFEILSTWKIALKLVWFRNQ